MLWHQIKQGAWSAVSSPPWWRQQTWIVTTEVLMGFLAAWGLVHGISFLKIGLGLGLVYALSAIGLSFIRHNGRRAGIVLCIIGVLFLTLGVFNWLGMSWWGLCFSIGILLSFRDSQSIQALAWLPIKTKKNNGNNMVTLTVTSIFTAVLLAIGMLLFGFGSQYWSWFPYLIAAIAFGVWVPDLLLRMSKGVGWRYQTPNHWRAQHPEQISWLLSLGTAFNALNFMGRRLLIPLVVISLAQNHLNSDIPLPILGAVLGIAGALGAIARTPLVVSKGLTTMDFIKWGARFSLTGWVLLGVGVILNTAQLAPSAVVLIVIGIGWTLFELSNRTWSIAFMDQLRQSAQGKRLSAARAHRSSLHYFMMRRSMGASLGCLVGGLASPAFAPVVVLGLALGCWYVLESPKKLSH